MSSQVFRVQVLALTHANLKSRYRKTIAGFLWVIINPVLMFGVQSLVFSSFLNIPVPNYLLFLLSGLLPWIFLVQSMEMCTPVFVNQGGILKAFQVDPLVTLVAQILDNWINFLGAFLILLLPVWYLQPSERSQLALLPVAALILGAGVFGICWLLATLQVFYRDTRFLVSFGTSIAFFLTPIFYPSALVPERWRWLITINPLYRLIAPFRVAIHDYDPHAFGSACLIGATVAAVLVAVAAAFWKARKNAIYLAI